MVELARTLADILAEAAVHDPPLAFRGAVSFGQFVFEDDFVCGPAVDDAASAFEVAEGAITWLTPAALRHWKPRADGKDEAEMHGEILRLVEAEVSCLFEHRIPLKGGTALPSLAVNPLASILCAEGPEHHRGTYAGHLRVRRSWRCCKARSYRRVFDRSGPLCEPNQQVTCLG